MTAVLLLSLVVFVGLSFFFAGYETGAYTVSRVRLRGRVASGDPAAGRVKRFLEDPASLITSVLIGNNIANYGATASLIALLGSSHRAELEASAILTPTLFVLGETLPKDLFRLHAESWVYRASRLMRLIGLLFLPATRLIGRAQHGLLRLLGAPALAEEVAISRRYLRLLFVESHEAGLITTTQHELAGRIVGLETVRVRDAMIPLRRLHLLEVGATVGQVRSLARATGHSRFPVFERRRSHIVGVLNLFDLALAQPEPDDSIEPFVRDVPEVSPSLEIGEAIRRVKQCQDQMGIVREGGFAIGAVTLKDLVEEIVGELGAY